MKIGIIIDSSTGLTKKEAEARGWGYLPITLNIGGKEYKDGVDIDYKKFYQELKSGINMHTATTSPALILDEVQKMAKKYDFVVVYTISKELSSQCDSVEVATREEFKNVVVVKSMGVCRPIALDAEYIEKMAKKEDDIDIIHDAANELAKLHEGILIVETLDWLIKGGRISPMVAKMANVLKIIPLIKFSSGKLEKHGVARIFKKAVTKGFEDLYKKMGQDADYILYHGMNDKIDEIKKEAERILKREIDVHPIPPVIAIHTGPGAIALMSRKRAD